MAKVDPTRCVRCDRVREAAIHERDAAGGHAFTPPRGTVTARRSGWKSVAIVGGVIAGFALLGWLLS